MLLLLLAAQSPIVIPPVAPPPTIGRSREHRVRMITRYLVIIAALALPFAALGG